MRLFLLFVAIPLIEIALFIQVGGLIGLGWTLLTVVLTAAFGAMLVRSQGFAVLGQVRGSFEELDDPTEPLAHGAMILFSGALLLTPGFFTDAVGFALLVPAVRRWIYRTVRKRMIVTEIDLRSRSKGPTVPDIVDAEFEDIEPPKRSSGPSGWTRH